jgi:hypothetical protein
MGSEAVDTDKMGIDAKRSPLHLRCEEAILWWSPRLAVADGVYFAKCIA